MFEEAGLKFVKAEVAGEMFYICLNSALLYLIKMTHNVTHSDRKNPSFKLCYFSSVLHCMLFITDNTKNRQMSGLMKGLLTGTHLQLALCYFKRQVCDTSCSDTRSCWCVKFIPDGINVHLSVGRVGTQSHTVELLNSDAVKIKTIRKMRQFQVQRHQSWTPDLVNSLTQQVDGKQGVPYWQFLELTQIQ